MQFIKGLAFLFLGVTFLNAQVSENELHNLDQYIEKAIQQWEVPGLAISIVKDDKAIFSKAYGVQELGKEKPVDEQTIFAICSTTKAMTAAAMGMLVDEGKVKWEDRVVNHMPEFQLYDPYVTKELRVKDLFTHNTGLGNADFLWYTLQLPPKEILNRMRMAKPAYPFRGGYTYQNIMYLAAGQLIEKISGKPWEQFIKDRIFKPLEMKHSFPTKEASIIYKNRSVPHHYINGKISSIPDASADRIAPAGAIWSSIEDMTKWLRFVLNEAKVDGKRLLSQKTYAEWLKPQVIVPPHQFYPTTALTKPHWTTYALGWFQHDYNGRFVSFHTGSLQGTIAIIGIIPDENLGVYVLGNLDHAELRHALMYKVFDFFGKEKTERDWSTEVLELYTGIKERSQKQQETLLAERMKNTNPSQPIEAYIGNYFDPYLGKIKITLSDGRLILNGGANLSMTLEHWHYDTFKGQPFPWSGPMFVKFENNIIGEITYLKVGEHSTYKKQK